MLPYYIGGQMVMLLVWFFIETPLPLWVTFLPTMAALLHLGVVIGIFVAGAVMIGIMARGQKRTFME